jgi:hypothetical protein
LKFKFKSASHYLIQAVPRVWGSFLCYLSQDAAKYQKPSLAASARFFVDLVPEYSPQLPVAASLATQMESTPLYPRVSFWLLNDLLLMV